MQALPVLALTGASQLVSIPTGYGGGWAKIANESIYALQIGIGVSNDWLQPGMVDVVPIGYDVPQISIAPSALTTIANSPSAQAFITLRGLKEGPFPGIFPATLTRDVAQNQTILTAAFNIQTLGAGSNATLVSGVAGQSIYVLGVTMDLAEAIGAAGKYIQISDSHSHFALIAGLNATRQWVDNFSESLQMTAGDALLITNQDTIAHNALVNIRYRQY